MEKFCSWQVRTQDDPHGTYTCMAHLAEARAFICPYRSSQVYQTPKGGLRIAHRAGSNLVAVCEDFELEKGFKLGEIPTIPRSVRTLLEGSGIVVHFKSSAGEK